MLTCAANTLQAVLCSAGLACGGLHCAVQRSLSGPLPPHHFQNIVATHERMVAYKEGMFLMTA